MKYFDRSQGKHFGLYLSYLMYQARVQLYYVRMALTKNEGRFKFDISRWWLFKVDAYVLSGTLTAIYVCICARRNMRRSYPWRDHTWMRTQRAVGTWPSRHVKARDAEGDGASFRRGSLALESRVMRPRMEQAAGIPLPTRENQSGILRGVTACFTILNHAGLSSLPTIR